MPVPSQIGFVLRHDYKVPDALRDISLAPGARIQLACLIWLNGVDDHRSHRSTQQRPEHDSDYDAQEEGHDQHIQG